VAIAAAPIFGNLSGPLDFCLQFTCPPQSRLPWINILAAKINIEHTNIHIALNPYVLNTQRLTTIAFANWGVKKIEKVNLPAGLHVGGLLCTLVHKMHNVHKPKTSASALQTMT